MFRKYVFNHLKTIEDFRNDGYIERKINRESIKICFIDDEGFDTDSLKQTGYKNVTWKERFGEINDYASYNIIACDIVGVGEELKDTRQGIAVAETLKRNYPDKIIFIYSSNSISEYDDHFYEKVDGHFSKAASSVEIAKIFDKEAARLIDEIAAWKNIEKELRGNGHSNKTIAFIEDLYVRSLKKHINLFEEKKYISRAEAIFKCTKDTLAFAATILGLFL